MFHVFSGGQSILVILSRSLDEVAYWHQLYVQSGDLLSLVPGKKRPLSRSASRGNVVWSSCSG
jgi:hypothetical protein